MSAFDKFCQEIVAMEGMVSKIKNRKVRQKDAGWFQKLEKVASINELFVHAQNGEEDKWGVREKSANVEGKHVVIEIRKDAELSDSTVKTIKTAFGNIGKVQTLLAKKVVAEYNGSNGKQGPWEWTENKEEFKPRRESDVTGAIKFETFRACVARDGVKFELYFDDGQLWWGHVIVIDNAFDMKSGAPKSDFEYSIEG